MRQPGRRQMTLFLLAMLVPYLVLVGVSAHLLRQDRELREKRRMDFARQAIRRAREHLAGRLQAIHRDETLAGLKPGQPYRHPEVVFAGWLDEGRLVPPWEPERAARKSREAIARPPFRDKIEECEAAQFASRHPDAAVSCYDSAARGAEPQQAAWAQLLRSRALDRMGRPGEALAAFRRLLDTPADMTDDDGVPLALYAAQRLADTGSDWPRVLGAVRGAVGALPWMPALSAFLASEIVEKGARASGGPPEQLEAFGDLRARLAAHVRTIEQTEALQADIARLPAPSAAPSWILYGEEPWLVGTAANGKTGALVLAVHATDLLAAVESRYGIRFVRSADLEAEPFGDAFPGMRVRVEPSEAPFAEGTALPRSLYYLALALLAAAVMFAAWLLWRDLRREMELSGLRAQFVSSVSHELKTPLTAIRMYAETLQLGRADPGTRSEYLDTIVSESERLTRLVEGVLLFSKIEQGKQVYRFRPVRLSEAVEAAARALDYPLASQGFRLDMRLDEALPPVQADRDALEQAILNLLSNAMKYSGDARGIELGLRREDKDAVIRVADHGIGIAPDQQARIFDKFYRAPSVENDRIPGTGLGLALVAQIARAHGGRVEVQSEPGKGSTFLLHLPLDAARG